MCSRRVQVRGQRPRRFISHNKRVHDNEKDRRIMSRDRFLDQRSDSQIEEDLPTCSFAERTLPCYWFVKHNHSRALRSTFIRKALLNIIPISSNNRFANPNGADISQLISIRCYLSHAIRSYLCFTPAYLKIILIWGINVRGRYSLSTFIMQASCDSITLVTPTFLAGAIPITFQHSPAYIRHVAVDDPGNIIHPSAGARQKGSSTTRIRARGPRVREKERESYRYK